MSQKVVLPRDANNSIIPLVPAKLALAVTVDDSISSATDIVLNESSTFLEVTALDFGIFLRYAATASSSNFDEYIAAGATRNYLIPEGITTISVIQDNGAAKVRIIQK